MLGNQFRVQTVANRGHDTVNARQRRKHFSVGCGFAVAASVLLAAACGPTDGDPVRADFAGLVDLRGGRQIFMQCRGSGSPTVVLIAGKGNDAGDWSQILDPNDPIRNDPLDQVGAGLGHLYDSNSAVFPSVSKFTRTCAYDRPDTRLTGTELSTSRSQPHTVDVDVNDLREVLAAANEQGPYVLVAHSYGGFVSELHARTYPSDVAGMVMVDAASSRLGQAVSVAKLTVWDQTNRLTSPQSPEGVEVLDALTKLEAAGPIPELPTIVLTADKPYRTDLLPSDIVDASVTFADWLAGQDLLAPYLHAKHITNTNSGHHVYLYSPQLVIDAIRDVVDLIRAQSQHGSR